MLPWHVIPWYRQIILAFLFGVVLAYADGKTGQRPRTSR
jgi:hypothetical protein